MSCTVLAKFVSIFAIIATVAAFVFTILITVDTRDDPINNVKLDIFRDRYFHLNNLGNYQQNSKQCICGTEIVNDFCTEEQKLKGCVDSHYLNLADSVTECETAVQDLLKPEIKYISSVFDVKLNVLYGLAIVIAVALALLIPFNCANLFIECDCCHDWFRKNKNILYVIIASLNAIFFIVFCIVYAVNDARKFSDFLENCRFVRKLTFYEYFAVDDLIVHFLPFTILNGLAIILGVAASFLNIGKYFFFIFF